MIAFAMMSAAWSGDRPGTLRRLAVGSVIRVWISAM